MNFHEDSQSSNTESAAAPRNARMATLLDELARGQGYSKSLLPSVKFMRSTSCVPRLQVAYEPSIVIIAQGKKRGHLGGQVFHYNADNYLVLSVPIPFQCDTEGSEEEPMLGVSIGVTPALIAELMMEVEKLPPPTGPQRLAIQAVPMDANLSDATVRLLESLRSVNDAKVLAPLFVREIAYRVLCGEHGETLRSLATPHTHFGQISRVMHRMHIEYAKPMDMTELAADAGMSVSNFHNHFKAITSSPPLQYLKSVRLHKARLLMVHENLNAASAAREVGYESVSQFSREFKRYFGDTPMVVAEQLRKSLMSLV